MVSILDIIEENRSKQRFLTSKSNVQKAFEDMRWSMVAIKDTPGFKQIRDYRAREVDTCSTRLRTMKSDDIKWVQAELNLSLRFLEFLDNILAPTVHVPSQEEDI